MASFESHCNWCQRTPESVGQALQRCGGCRILYYCQKACQQSDWKHHKEECQAIKAGRPIPSFKRAGVRLRGTSFLSQDPTSVAPDPDTVFYTKISTPHIFDVSIAGPFYPMGNIIEHIKARCVQEGSLPTLPFLDEIIQSVGIVGIEHWIAPLPDGAQMRIQIVHEKNPEVASFLRNCPPNAPRSVYSILEQTVHPQCEELMAGDWPFDFVPTLDLDVLGTFVSKDKANQEARKTLDGWRANAAPGEGVGGDLLEGLMMGSLTGRDGANKRILMVNLDDGMIQNPDGTTRF